MRGLAFGAAAFLDLAGGGEDPGGSLEDAAVVDAARPPLEIAAPAPPEAPRILPCPDGWRESRTVEDTLLCEPWPAAGRRTCGPASMHLPGAVDCTTVGSACPSGAFPALPPDTVAVYVAPGGTGDGTAAAPFGTVVDALAASTAGTTVVVATGRYEEALRVPSGVTIRGSCAERTFLAPTESSRFGTVHVTGGDVVIQNLTIAGLERPGVTLDAGAGTALEGVAIEGTLLAGIIVVSASLDARDLLVRGTRRDSGGAFGRGLSIERGATVDVARASIEGDGTAGAHVSGFGTSAMLVDVALAPVGALGFHRGLSAQAEARAELVRGSIEAVGEHALAVVAAAAVTGTDVRVRDAGGIAAIANHGSSLAIRRGALTGGHLAGVHASDGGSSIIEDSISEHNLPDADGVGGRGAAVTRGARLELARVALENNRETGVTVHEDGTTLEGSDIRIVATAARPDGLFGRGATITTEARAQLERVAVERCQDIGVLVDLGAWVVLNDLRVSRTEGRMLDGTFGRALAAQLGSNVGVSRAVLDGNREASVTVFHAETHVSLTNVRVTDTRERACAAGPCADAAMGIGLGAYLGGRMRAESFVIERSAVCGVHIASSGELDLTRGEIAESPIGACIQVEGYEIDRLRDGVVYRNNGVNLDATDMPVPDAAL